MNIISTASSTSSDIEEQFVSPFGSFLSDFDDQIVSPFRSTSSDIGGGPFPIPEFSRPHLSEEKTFPRSKLLLLARICSKVWPLPLVVVGVLLPLIGPLVLMLMCTLPKNMVRNIYWRYAFHYGKSEGEAGIYDKSRRREPILTLTLSHYLRLISTVGWLILLWVAFNASVPRLKRVTLLGSPAWKWSLLGLTLVYAYMEALSICILIAILILSFQRKTPMNTHFARLMLPSAALVIYIGLILLSWLLYFRTENGVKPASTPHPEAFGYVTWTCVSLFIASILWFLKVYFLTRWSSGAIYHRFEPMILITAVKYFYLGLIIDGSFEPNIYCQLLASIPSSAQTNFSFTDHIMSANRMPQPEAVCHILMSLAEIVRSLEEDGIVKLQRGLEEKIKGSDQKCGSEALMNLLDCKDKLGEGFRFQVHKFHKDIANGLYELVREECSLDDFTFDDLKKWLVSAHINCVNMGRTLSDANVIVTRLDIFMSCIIFVVGVLLWLLITGIATTKVLVTIATPLLLFSFVFGDTAKIFFQGLIFCFLIHPYDVGDRCILDETELEVKRIGVLTTTFTKIGTKENRMYPNSVLATKSIANLGWKPDPTDVVEITLDSSAKLTDVLCLEEKIKEYFGAHKQHYRELQKVEIKEIGESIKLRIQYTHVLRIHEITHNQCFETKSKQRPELLKVIKRYIDEIWTTVQGEVHNRGDEIVELRSKQNLANESRS